jgi:hypothetical protein
MRALPEGGTMAVVFLSVFGFLTLLSVNWMRTRRRV